MKRSKLILLLLLLLSAFCSAQKDTCRGTIKVYRSQTALCKITNIRYPESARLKGISGICYISFSVNKNGEICNVAVLQGVPGCPECDDEAFKAVLSMPKWKPSVNDQKNISVRYTLPIAFTLQ